MMDNGDMNFEFDIAYFSILSFVLCPLIMPSTLDIVSFLPHLDILVNLSNLGVSFHEIPRSV
jgi:hypothetical protein